MDHSTRFVRTVPEPIPSRRRHERRLEPPGRSARRPGVFLPDSAPARYLTPMRLRLASWNINSVRPRAEQVARFIREAAPDVLCLQETERREGEFPGPPPSSSRLAAPADRGARRPCMASPSPPSLLIEETPWRWTSVARAMRGRCRAKIGGVDVHNFYILGRRRHSRPRAEIRSSTTSWIFYERLTAAMGAPGGVRLRQPSSATSTWAPRAKTTSGTTSFTSRVAATRRPEIEAMARPKAWWPYFHRPGARDPGAAEAGVVGGAIWRLGFRKSNRGLRLDHILDQLPDWRDAAFRIGLGRLPHPRGCPRLGASERPCSGDGGSGKKGKVG